MSNTTKNMSKKPTKTNMIMESMPYIPLTDDSSLDNYHMNGEEKLSFLLLDEKEKLLVSSKEQFLEKLNIKDDSEKVKVVSIFGNTGEGKSYTFNKVFFSGKNVFKTSPDQRSCTLGVWAAYDPVLKVICLDTEGLLGMKKEHHQRTRLLLKVLVVSDIVIYRTRAERLQADMYTFLSGASQAYKQHFEPALLLVWQKLKIEGRPEAIGPSLIIFHETKHTNTLDMCTTYDESPEDIIRARCKDMHMSIDAFRSIKYIGQKIEEETSFFQLEGAVQSELSNTTVRSKRDPSIIYLTLKVSPV